MQALLFAALLANARAHIDGDPFFAPVAGGLLGLLLFLRFDVVLGILGVAVGLALGVLDGRRARWPFLLALRCRRRRCDVYLLGPMRAYASAPILSFSDLANMGVRGPWASSVSPGSRSVALAARAVGHAARRDVGARRDRRWHVAAGCLRAFFRHPAGKLAVHDADALRTFTDLYLSLPPLIAALAGLGYCPGVSIAIRPSSARLRSSPASSSTKFGSSRTISG